MVNKIWVYFNLNNPIKMQLIEIYQSLVIYISILEDIMIVGLDTGCLSSDYPECLEGTIRTFVQ